MKKALVGIQWGDEGKGKYVTKFLDGRELVYGVCARFNGGGNAGHTIFTLRGEELATHQLPSGVVFPGIYNAMLGGVFVDPVKLKKEIDDMLTRGYDISPKNLGISGLAHVTLRHHHDVERMGEEIRARIDPRRKIGTTFSGIGPTAEEKYGRWGMRFAEFLNAESFGKLVYAKKKELADKGVAVEMDDYPALYVPLREFFAPFMMHESEFYRARAGENWLYEGAQGMMLDPECGSYPFVTSTNIRPPADTDEVIGVAKAYITRVGGGPLPTQMDPETDALIRGVRGTTGAEFGATTGRPRSCGWFDVPVARHTIALAGVHKVAIVKLDVLSRVPVIKVCTHYDCNGKKLELPPEDRFEFEQCKPSYLEVKGWPGVDISGVREFTDLPQAAQDYMRVLQNMIMKDIDYISVGPRAEQTVVM